MAAFSLSTPASRCLIALLLVASFSATAVAWGLERTPRRADHRYVESTYKHHRPIGSINRQQQWKADEEADLRPPPTRMEFSS